MIRSLIPLLLIAAMLWPVGDARAWSEGDRITSIAVAGNSKVESAAILDIIHLREGDLLSRDAVADAIRDIYRLRYFRDIKVSVDDAEGGVAVVIEVLEKPAIREVIVDGNKKITIEDIKEVMTLKPYSILDEAKVRANAHKIEELYLDKGFFLAQIDTQITESADNEVNVSFTISENKKVLVKEIDIIGAENIKPSFIKARLQTKAAGIFPGIGEAGTYRREVLRTDAEIIAYLYSAEGYVDVHVGEPEAKLSPDKRWVHITIHVDEGEQYRVGEVRLSGDLTVPDENGQEVNVEEELRERIKTHPGDVFNRVQLGEDVERLVARYADEGYAFANVIPLPRQDHDRRIIDLEFNVQKGNLITLEDVTITGNVGTWDKVIRREVGVMEGDLFRGNQVERTRRRLERLGYFEEVKITTPRGEADDSIDLAIDVTEKPTGTFSIGAGFSSIESFVFTANISRANFLGLGYTMALSANLSLGRNLVERGFFNGENSQQQINFQLFDPYLFDTRWTGSVSLFSTNRTYNVSEFARGFNLSLGHYIGKDDDAQVSVRYALESVGLTALSASQKSAYGGQLYRSGTKSALSASLLLDKRDNRISPTRGFYATASAELAGGFRVNKDQVLSVLGGDFRFFRTQFNWRLFYPIGTPLVVFRWNFSAGWIKSLDGSVLPYTERYRAGGINSIRGFAPLSLGPQIRYLGNADPVHAGRSLPVGGTASLVNNLEVEFPIIPQAQVRGVVFFDSGNAFGGIYGDEPFYWKDIRLSAGFGVRWRSPMGPLRFEWGFPIGRKPGEQPQVFEFTIGSFF